MEAAEGGASGFEVMPLEESPFRPEDCHRLHEAAGRNEVIRTPQETQVQMSIPTRSVWIGLVGGHLAVHRFQKSCACCFSGHRASCASALPDSNSNNCHRGLLFLSLYIFSPVQV